MKEELLRDIKNIAKDDFIAIRNQIRQKKSDITASINHIKYYTKDNTVTATCRFNSKESNSPIEATINYINAPDGIFADTEIDDLSDAILSTINSYNTPITAADEDEEDPFRFEDEIDDKDAFDFDAEIDPDVETELSDEIESDDPYDNPEEETNIEPDNNIAGHYIAECDRCHGVFISALVESDQQVEFLSGICPLCEKESDQYIKWVIKPVEF